MSDFQAIVIGGGPGGYVAAIRLGQLGIKTAVIEKENMGGVCLNWGCIPSKALIHVAKTYYNAGHAQAFGISATNVQFDRATAQGWKDAMIKKLTGGIGPDIVAETAGAAQTPVDAINWTRRGGTTVLVGIYSATPQMNFNEIVGVERRVIGSVAAGPGDMAAAVAMIGSGRIKVKDLITAKVPLSRVIEDGFNRMIQPEKDVFRILIRPGE